MVQVSGFEPEYLAWKAKILTARLHLRGALIIRSPYFNPSISEDQLEAELKIKVEASGKCKGGGLSTRAVRERMGLAADDLQVIDEVPQLRGLLALMVHLKGHQLQVPYGVGLHPLNGMTIVGLFRERILVSPHLHPIRPTFVRQ